MAGIRYKGQIFSGTASYGEADDVSYDNTTSGLTATDVQDALDEVSNAEGVSYDNTQSGLTATDVQGALDEVSNAEGVSYDNSQSGLTATDVQGAVDELESNIQNNIFTFKIKDIEMMSDNTTNILEKALPTETGYTPVGIVGYAAMGAYAAGTNLYRLCIRNDNGKLSVGWSPAVVSTAGVNVQVLYVKNGIKA